MSLPILPDQYQTISLSGAMVNLEYCGIEGAIALLREQYAIGTVTAKRAIGSIGTKPYVKPKFMI